MLNLQEVLEKNIKVPVPRGNFSDEEKRRIFATNRGWMKMREDGKNELLIVLRNLDLKIKDLVKSQNIVVNDAQNIIETKPEEIFVIENEEQNTFFDLIETEDGIENKKLKKGNLVRFYLIWNKPINIKANDGLKTYIEVYNDKDKILGNAFYRERINEKTLMFVYKLGKEKINGMLKVNPTICDGRIKDNEGNIIISPNKLFNIEGIFANIE